ncbi:uncharacterized mitochondrial protein AtMg00860-like [Nicotiana tomentosiformis]|uniref:uncharacterized mitochondrial protein AtMg00860-like n=1 Tax=Nicotiana tomentosiformis TaxID=4098 RepID=UPI00388C6A23
MVQPGVVHSVREDPADFMLCGGVGIQRLLQMLSQGAKYFSMIGLRSGYRQLKIKEQDIPRTVFRTSWEDHADHLIVVLRTLHQHKLYAKFSKCEFLLESVIFLGHVVSREGIKVDPQKISTVKNCPNPTTPTAIHNFLGLAGYYRKFV